jgi:hypothetical protein
MDNYYDYWGSDAEKSRNCVPNTFTPCTSPFNYKIERFSPPYFEQARLTGRPQIITAPSVGYYGQKIVLKVASPNPVIRFTFIRYGTVTHSTNTDQRFVELIIDSKWQDGTFVVRLPSNRNQAPPGNWFIFALDDKGVPSEALTLSMSDNSNSKYSSSIPIQFKRLWTPILIFIILSL